jgi:hypothetical protein
MTALLPLSTNTPRGDQLGFVFQENDRGTFPRQQNQRIGKVNLSNTGHIGYMHVSSLVVVNLLTVRGYSIYTTPRLYVRE